MVRSVGGMVNVILVTVVVYGHLSYVGNVAKILIVRLEKTVGLESGKFSFIFY